MDLSVDQVRDALTFISPSESRNEWVIIGMAIKAEFGESGFELFDGWSQGSDKYKKRDCMTTWKSIKASGGTGIGTLIKAAQEKGWNLVKEERDEAAQAAYQKELAERRAKAKADAEKAEAHLKRMADVASMACSEIISWVHHQEAGTSEYLARKRVGAFNLYIASKTCLVVIDDVAESFQLLHGADIRAFFTGFNADEQPHLAVRMIKPGTLIIPMYKFGYQYARGVQLINNSGSKSFLKYAEKSECYAVLGQINNETEIACAAEGYATAASIHMATGLPCLVTFDAGNLVKVVKEFHKNMPHLSIAVCADNDAKTKDNPGVTCATDAANAVGGALAIPDFSALGKAANE